MSAWTDTVTRVYNEKHAKNPNYKFKQAMKDAKKVYKKGGSTEKSKHLMDGGKSRKVRQSRKMRKSRKMRGGIMAQVKSI